METICTRELLTYQFLLHLLKVMKLHVPWAMVVDVHVLRILVAG